MSGSSKKAKKFPEFHRIPSITNSVTGSERGYRTSNDFFETNWQTFGIGPPESIDSLFDYHSSKDFWSKWFHMLEHSTRDPHCYKVAHESEDWAVMMLQVLHRANKLWGGKVLPPGKLLQPNGEFNRPVGWSESGLKRFKERVTSGNIPYPESHFHENDRFMVIDDYLEWFECKRDWQEYKPSFPLAIIPDVWVYRVIETLSYFQGSTSDVGEVCKRFILVNPTMHYGQMLSNYVRECRDE